ncbi:MAG TPA: hypothetical protein VF297_32590 [Pyrinomonadaceae bacterium]
MSVDASEVKQGRVCVVGCGHVGTTSAYALMLGGQAREVVLLDVDARRAEGEAMDLEQAAALARPVEVRAGDWEDAARSSIVVVAAGVGGRPGESRLDLLGRNAVVSRDLMRSSQTDLRINIRPRSRRGSSRISSRKSVSVVSRKRRRALRL